MDSCMMEPFMLNKWYFDLVGTKQMIVLWFMFIFMINFVEFVSLPSYEVV